MVAQVGRRTGYRPELDGMRTVAVLAVFAFHAAQPHRFGGFVGVDVFFVLSGFLITGILHRELTDGGRIGFGRFYLGRLLRLYPALLVVLVVTAPFAATISGSFGLHAKNSLVAATYTANLYQTYRHHWLGGLSHTWSLALEEQYYLVWPLVLALLWRAGVRRAATVALLLVVAAVTAVLHVRDFSYGAISYPIQSTTTGLLVGSALALLPLSRLTARWAGTMAWAGAALLVAELVAFSTTRLADSIYTPVAVLATALLIAGTTAAFDGVLPRLLGAAPMAYLGRISYGFYLWHYPVLSVLRNDTSMSFVAQVAVSLVLTLALAMASHRWVERPFLRIKARLGNEGAYSRRELPADARQPG